MNTKTKSNTCKNCHASKRGTSGAHVGGYCFAHKYVSDPILTTRHTRPAGKPLVCHELGGLIHYKYFYESATCAHAYPRWVFPRKFKKIWANAVVSGGFLAEFDRCERNPGWEAIALSPCHASI